MKFTYCPMVLYGHRQDSLGGDAKTCIFVNVSPAESNLSETVGTINFGNSIRSIELKGGGSKSKKKQ